MTISWRAAAAVLDAGAALFAAVNTAYFVNRLTGGRDEPRARKLAIAVLLCSASGSARSFSNVLPKEVDMDLALPKEFHEAVARKDWETAALHALLAAAEFIEEHGAEAVEAMLEELETDDLPAHSPTKAQSGRA